MNCLHSTTFKCISQKGALFKMKAEIFKKLKKSDKSWSRVKKIVSFRDTRLFADDIAPMNEVVLQDKKQKEHKAKADPFLFEIMMRDRHVIKGKIQPYSEHPDYLQHLEN